jgi:CDP-glucose 4,6-dehydratase
MADTMPSVYSKAFNFGPLPDDYFTVRQLAEKTIETWGNGNWKDCSDPEQPHEAGLLKLDISLARQELAWEPKLSTSESVEWTINWYKKTISEQADYSFQQIKDYFAL